jgi:hypothetical protein
MSKKKIFQQDKIAMVYDFDGTLSPQPMQEYTVLPELDISPEEFWKEVNEEATQTKSDSMLTYMRLMLEKADEKQIHIGKTEFKRLGRAVKYFPGVEEWFELINKYVLDRGKKKVTIRHYVISSGVKEILEGIGIKKHFSNVYASEYYYDHHGVAKFPKLLVTDTSKTQFLFRINKGREQLTESINDHMPESDRPVPFANIIYLGDGLTDVPCMTVSKKNGGHAVAVYKPNTPKAKEKCKQLLVAGRVDFIAAADYSERGILMKRVKLLLDSVISGIEYQREVFACKRSVGLL